MGGRRARWLAALAVGGCLLPACRADGCNAAGGFDSMVLTLPEAAETIVRVCQDDECYGPLDAAPGPDVPLATRTGTTLNVLLRPGSLRDRASTITATTNDGRTLTGPATRPTTSYPNGKGCDPTVRALTATLV